MKKTFAKLVAILLILSSVIGLCSCYNIDNVAPIPDFTVKEIEYIDVFDDFDNRSQWVRVADEDIETILGYLANAKPYRESVQDAVYGEDYRALNIRTIEEDNCRCYIYQKRGKTLLEIPYAGIYTVESAFFDYLDDYLK